MAARGGRAPARTLAADRAFLSAYRQDIGLRQAPSSLSDTYVRRIAPRLREQYALGRPFDLAAARRGYTGAAREHAGRTAPPRTAERQVARRQVEGIRRDKQLVVTPEGAIDVTTSDRARLVEILEAARDRGAPAVRLSVKVGDQYYAIDGGARGLTPEYLLGVLQGRSLRSAMRQLLEGPYRLQAPRRGRRARPVRRLSQRIDVEAGVRIVVDPPRVAPERVA